MEGGEVCWFVCGKQRLRWLGGDFGCFNGHSLQ